jgi:exodeoxyribonuclease VII large subunit
MQLKAFTVSGLNRYMAQLIKADPLLSVLTVEGELANYKVHASGHAYFQLKDETSRVDCVMFKHSHEHLKETFREGDHVRIRGQAGLYERDGRFQVYARTMEKIGLGALYEAYLKEKDRLEALGYFDEQRKRPLPAYPERIGIVSSASGAAIRDVISVLRHRNPTLDLILYPSLVQGEGAADNLAEGIRYFDTREDVDAVILTRGGGSIEDLWAFNETRLVEAVYKSRHPVISAVGHETDHTLCDFVADLRAPTPSAAAERVSPTVTEMMGRAEAYLQVGRERINRRMAAEERLLSEDYLRRMESEIRYRLEREEGDLINLLASLSNKAEAHLGRKEQEALATGDLLEANSPLRRLKAGYGYIEKDKVPVRSVRDLAVGETISVRLSDGNLRTTVDEIEVKDRG